MNFEEHAAKALLRRSGIATPEGRTVQTPEEAEAAAFEFGPCAVKAQIPAGKRGKAGGIRLAETPAQARDHAHAILGMDIGGWIVKKLLIEARVLIARELYAAVLTDPASKGPVLLFLPMGGVDVEETAEKGSGVVRRFEIPIAEGLSDETARAAIDGLGLDAMASALSATLQNLYRTYRGLDAELVEINPLAITTNNHVIALDCKLTVDDSAAPRQQEIAALAAIEKQTPLEAKAAAVGLKYIELDGSVGVLANGAGLTMTTMDVIAHYGGRAANFLEIGGEAYTKAKLALSILLENPNVKSLLVNFCGAFARTDVMAEGVVSAWEELKPDIPVFFTIHGTGEDEAIALVQNRLGITPYNLMDDAVEAAVAASQGKAMA